MLVILAQLAAFGLKVGANFIKAPTNFLVAGLLVFGSYQTGHWRGDNYRNGIWKAQIEAEKKAQLAVIQVTSNRAIGEVIRLSIEQEKQNDLIATLRAAAIGDSNAGNCGISASGVQRLNRISPK